MKLYSTGPVHDAGIHCPSVHPDSWPPLWSHWAIFSELIHVGGAIG